MASFSLLLLKHIPRIPLRLPHPRSPSRSLLLFFTSAGRASADPSPPLDRFPPPATASASAAGSTSDPSLIYGTNPLQFSRTEHPDYRRWKDKEEEILQDIEPITFLTKEILHSKRYMDGERLTAEDEKAVAEKLLAYHPHSEDKIGCGLNSIMVDRHPQFQNSRCLFVVRTDGGWIDFSYQKCLRAYIHEKYPSYAERFIREHFKRT